jgi:hypothetical protein
MRWSDEEKLKLALPYGRWQWRDDDGETVETSFNRKYQAIATRVNGQSFHEVRYPPEQMMPAEYFYGENTNTFPYSTRGDGAETRRWCRAILRSWGIDPDVRLRAVAREWKNRPGQRRDIMRGRNN